VPQAIARLRVGGVTPEERGELVARMRLTGANGEIGEEGLGLGGQGDRRPVAQPGLEAAEQRQRQTRQRVTSPSSEVARTIARGDSGERPTTDATLKSPFLTIMIN
jgi:hypothetical protein